MKLFDAYELMDLRPAPIGHNGGPPLDLSFQAWAWRRAHARAWKSPGREVALMRLRQAERLGISYREYTSVLLDRGVRLGALVIFKDAALSFGADAIAQKRAKLGECAVMECIADEDETDAEIAARILAFAREAQLPLSALFLVGEGALARAVWARAKLGLFVEARRYFGPMSG